VAELAGFLALAAVVICTPGQDTALTIRNALRGGRRSGVATAAGVALGQICWTVAAAAGVVAVLRASQPAFTALRLAGAAYLVYLGLQSLVAALRRREHRLSSVRATSGGSLRQGLVSNLANYGITVARARRVLERDRVRRTFDAATGTVLVALGLRVAATQR
jgi:threonine/homoserine/homoserine lactone efflux protein